MKNHATSINSIKLYLNICVLFLLVSCQKSDVTEPIGNSQAKLKINLSVGQADEGKILVGSKNTSKRSNKPTIQKSEVKLGNGFAMEVSVIEDNAANTLSRSTSSSNAENRAATQPVIKPLDEGVRYKLVAFSESGQFEEEADFIYGSEGTDSGLLLDADRTYTFIIYSVNSTSELPQIETKDLLSTAKLNEISGDLMFFKKTMKLNFGENTLDAILEHKFSQITTHIEMDDSMTGSIEDITGSFFNSSKTSAGINFSDGALIFPNTNVNSPVTFTNILPDSRNVVSNKVLLISPETTTASFNIGSIRIDSETKTNITIPEINITPGEKYNLIIRFKVCTEDVTAEGMNWSFPEISWTELGLFGFTTYHGIFKTDENRRYKDGEVIRNTFQTPNADYGVQFDITELDNAFNIKVNNTLIFKNSDLDQIQFENKSNLNMVRNIQFADGSEYATDGIPEIFDMKGSYATPLLRVLISRHGEVSILGSKTNNGPLFPLKLKDNQTFNTVPWNPTGNNTVIVSQKVSSRTVIIGKISGKKLLSCN